MIPILKHKCFSCKKFIHYYTFCLCSSLFCLNCVHSLRLLDHHSWHCFDDYGLYCCSKCCKGSNNHNIYGDINYSKK